MPPEPTIVLKPSLRGRQFNLLANEDNEQDGEGSRKRCDKVVDVRVLASLSDHPFIYVMAVDAV